MEADRSGARQLAVRLDLTDAELELVRTALRLLEDTLGHEEAAELDEVQELIARLPPAPGAGRPSGDG